MLNILLTEWNLDDAKKVWYEDGKLEIAKNLLTEGSTPEFVQKITGLEMETILELNK